jgi:hypothetical protein
MEHFTEETLRNMLWSVWQRHEREEAERKRREEDEESWRIARKHQTSRLQVKYFYRWRSNARALATKRILREGKEKMRLYREQQKAIKRQLQEEKETAEREARRAAKRQLMEDSQRLALLASSSGRRGSVAYSTDHNPEEQLIASGIFGGLRDDPRSVARRVVRDAINGADASALGSSFRYAESELELEPARSPRDSPDASSVGGRREGWKTRSLREKFSIEPRRSLSASGSVVNGGSFMSSSSRFRQSLPGSSNNKTTNFSASSRKRPAEDESDDGQSGYYGAKTNGFSRSRHWEMRVRGLVPMPDGGYLPEALAKSTMAARSVPYRHLDDDHDGAGSVSGSPDDERDLYLPDARAASPTPSDLRLRLARLKKRSQLYPARSGHAPRHSVDLATSPPHPPFGSMQPPPRVPRHSGGDRTMTGMGKRKRGEEGGEEEGGETDREVSPSARKRAAVLGNDGGGGGGGGGAGVVPGREETSAMVENTRRMLREMRELMDRADRDEGGYLGG